MAGLIEKSIWLSAKICPQHSQQGPETDPSCGGKKTKILFTSDLHEDISAIERFSALLGTGTFELGVIAGDIMEYDLSLDEMRSTPGVEDDDLLEELYDPMDTIEDFKLRVSKYRRSKATPLYKASKIKELEVRNILKSSGKPIVLVPGNHDIAEWHTDKQIHNVHNKPVSFGGFDFIGFRYTSLELSPTQEQKYFKRVHQRITNKTVLVTHAPPFGILDQNYRGNHIGSKTIAEASARPEVVLHLFGHVHNSFGFFGKSANGSYIKGKRFISIDTENMLFEYCV